MNLIRLVNHPPGVGALQTDMEPEGCPGYIFFALTASFLSGRDCQLN